MRKNRYRFNRFWLIGCVLIAAFWSYSLTDQLYTDCGICDFYFGQGVIELRWGQNEKGWRYSEIGPPPPWSPGVPWYDDFGLRIPELYTWDDDLLEPSDYDGYLTIPLWLPIVTLGLVSVIRRYGKSKPPRTVKSSRLYWYASGTTFLAFTSVGGWWVTSQSSAYWAGPGISIELKVGTMTIYGPGLVNKYDESVWFHEYPYHKKVLNLAFGWPRATGRVKGYYMEEGGNQIMRFYPPSIGNPAAWWFLVSIPFWILVPGLFVISALSWQRAIRAVPLGHCRNCAYDLRGVSATQCPECGFTKVEATQVMHSSASSEKKGPKAIRMNQPGRNL